MEFKKELNNFFLVILISLSFGTSCKSEKDKSTGGILGPSKENISFLDAQGKFQEEQKDTLGKKGEDGFSQQDLINLKFSSEMNRNENPEEEIREEDSGQEEADEQIANSDPTPKIENPDKGQEEKVIQAQKEMNSMAN